MRAGGDPGAVLRAGAGAFAGVFARVFAGDGQGLDALALNVPLGYHLRPSPAYRPLCLPPPAYRPLPNAHCLPLTTAPSLPPATFPWLPPPG